MTVKDEISYLSGMYKDIEYDKHRFRLMIGDDKYLFGVVSGNDANSPFSKLLQYKTLYDTLSDLNYKIKVSFDKALEYAYCESVLTKFNFFMSDSEEERFAYYYIENALFRTSSLWDLLAQFYRLYYGVSVDANKVYYNKLFNPISPHSSKFRNIAIEINEYFNQEDNTSCDGMWEGNHRYVNDCRNKMTHRNSPNVSAMSDYDINMKQHPTCMLKRIIEDYAVVTRYIVDILVKIEGEIKNNLQGYIQEN